MKTKRDKKQRVKTANLVRGIRKELNLTQEKMGAAIGKQRSDVARYESGFIVPPGDVLFDILRLYVPRIGHITL